MPMRPRGPRGFLHPGRWETTRSRGAGAGTRALTVAAPSSFLCWIDSFRPPPPAGRPGRSVASGQAAERDDSSVSARCRNPRRPHACTAHLGICQWTRQDSQVARAWGRHALPQAPTPPLLPKCPSPVTTHVGSFA
ncbi:hypothetical protein U9M48_020611 [Paspalum notatum var. saurae]|uniref:Uncharacterized protein n=1 Tax=Paspalum notatum var. saurae TaxID=547442 RepID=A0AAQ3TEL8_PASNO